MDVGIDPYATGNRMHWRKCRGRLIACEEGAIPFFSEIYAQQRDASLYFIYNYRLREIACTRGIRNRCARKMRRWRCISTEAVSCSRIRMAGDVLKVDDNLDSHLARPNEAGPSSATSSSIFITLHSIRVAPTQQISFTGNDRRRQFSSERISHATMCTNT